MRSATGACLIAIAVVVLAMIASTVCLAQNLPITNFTTAEGLAHNGILQIFQDDKGYLWVGTGEGLSRFDGYSFRNYGSRDGLPGEYINDITQDRNGRIWVAINDGGVARFLDDPAESATNQNRKFLTYSIADVPQAKNVGRIVFDTDNRMWCATEAGVFRARSADVDAGFEFVGPSGGVRPSARELLVDSRGRMWFGLVDRMLRIDNGELRYFDLPTVKPGTFVNGIVEMPDGRILASTDLRVFEYADSGESAFRDSGFAVDPDQSIESLGKDRDGSLLVGTTKGLVSIRAGVRRTYSQKNGLASDPVRAVFVDREETLWLGTSGGLSNRTNDAIVTFPDVPGGRPQRFTTDRSGNVFVQAGCHPTPIALWRVTDNGFEDALFPRAASIVCKRNQFQNTRSGEWWVGDSGLSILDDHRRKVRRPMLPGGEPIIDHNELYEDPDGRIWVSAADRNLYVSADGREFKLVVADIRATILMRDSRGAMWLGNNVFFGRLRPDGKLETIAAPGVVSTVLPRAIFEDSRRRLWVGTRYDGVIYTDDPDAAVPTFKKLGVDDGLASNTVWGIAEDNSGGIYFGTGRGVSRLDRTTGRIRHIRSADGVPENPTNHLFKDSQGRIWVASEGGVSRIDPSALGSSNVAPRVFISAATIAGDPVGLPDSGSVEFSSPDLSATQNNVALRFVGVDLRGDRALAYRYKLDGYDKDWSEAGKQREVTLANLGPGTYRFMVKAIDEQGIESEQPAVFTFQILPPIWQRWWFILLAAAAVVGILYVLYRYRMRRLLELERVRTRIATDLHDDIGSNLTRIALMSEVLNQQAGNGSSARMLPAIAEIARESVASMNDIVWAISPEHDRVLDLTRRMRQHAEEVFTIRDIDVEFVSDAVDSDLKLMVGVRRDVLLIFKEAVNNAARHSNCTKVIIEFSSTSSALRLVIGDNGDGFDDPRDGEGHGLVSMARRAAALGGTLKIESSPGVGTTVRLDMPL